MFVITQILSNGNIDMKENGFECLLKYRQRNGKIQRYNVMMHVPKGVTIVITFFFL